jgi:hypothetical protein
MTLNLALVAILLVSLAAAWLARSRAGALRAGGRLNSLPFYHGAYAFLWTALPALILVAAWTPIQTRLVNEAVLASPEGKALPDFDMQREMIRRKPGRSPRERSRVDSTLSPMHWRHGSWRPRAIIRQSAAASPCCWRSPARHSHSAG